MKIVETDYLLRYKTYFESWLNKPIDSIIQSNGVNIFPSEQRKLKPDGWILYMPVCAFEFEKSVIISCIPEWENDIKNLLAGVSISEAISRMRVFSEEKEIVTDAHYRFYGIGTPTEQQHSADVFLLDNNNYEQYLGFFRSMFPSQSDLIDPDEWLSQGFAQSVENKTHFCIAADNDIVCATDSESIPNEPDGIINLGVNTLKEYRGKGYASAVCTAFIKYHMQLGKIPIWQCEFGNIASQELARKLGFQLIGNVYYIASLLLLDS